MNTNSTTSYIDIHSLSQTRSPFHTMLNGENAFYNDDHYMASTKLDFSQKKTLQTISYTFNTENKVIRIAKSIVPFVIFPIGCYKLLQAAAAKAGILPSKKNQAKMTRLEVPLEGEWKHKRITVEADGYKIDGALIGKVSSLNNRRWVLVSNGNGGFYENKLLDTHDLKKILNALNANALIFNYPGVGASTGLPTRESTVKSYEAMLNLLEDSEKGIGAKEIIAYSESLGAGVQGHALRTHTLKKDIKYIFIKSRTFSTYSKAALVFRGRLASWAITLLRWNMNSVESSKKLTAPEIIMQRINIEEGYEIFNDHSRIIDDEMISPFSSLAKELLLLNEESRENKTFIGISETHRQNIKDCSFLTEQIKSLLEGSAQSDDIN